jgi:hypothetical protein
MQRVRIKGVAAFQSTPPEYMRDMLRYDDGKIEAIWDYPTGKRFESVHFTAIVQLHGYTPERWRSFGLVTDVLGDVGTESPQGYTVDEWVADRSPVQEPEAIRVLQNSDLIETDEGQPYQYCEASFQGVESKNCPGIMHEGDQVIKRGDDLYCIHCSQD